MTHLESWLHDMRTRSLPGGVAAAAVAAAMGAALVAKVLRITLERQPLQPGDRQAVNAVLTVATHEQETLLGLAQADVQAYEAVIDTQSLPAADPARQRAWQAATEVPLAVAEAGTRVLEHVETVLDQCWPGVCVDYEIGSELLQAAVRAATLAAEANLDAWNEPHSSEPLRARLDALSGG